MATELTPCGVLFETMKRYGGISHKDLARLVLSGRPLADGKSPLSRCDDRTWVSRFIVHAPVGSLQDRYFCDFGAAALRICARLGARDGKNLSGAGILSLVVDQGGPLMSAALQACHQDTALYDNVMARIAAGDGYTDEERGELAMVMFVAVACSGNVKRASAYLLDYVKSVHGGRLVTVPASMVDGGGAPESVDLRAQAQALGLLRVVDGLVTGSLHWVQPTAEGIEIGALALGPDDITDVGAGVSGHHARVFCNDEGCWCAEDLGSREGTLLVSGADRSEAPVAPGEPAPVHAGDELVLAGNTRFVLIEGMPEAW